jgi:hypothetical protein
MRHSPAFDIVAAVNHLCKCQPRPPTAAFRLGEIGKWAFPHFQWLDLLEQFHPRCRRKPVPRESRVHQLPFLVVADDESVEILGRGSVSANYKFLTLVHSHLLPGAGAHAWFISAIPALCNQSLQTLGLHRLNEIGQTCFQLRRIPDRFFESRHTVLLQQITPVYERFVHDVLAVQKEKVKDVEQEGTPEEP